MPLTAKKEKNYQARKIVSIWIENFRIHCGSDPTPWDEVAGSKTARLIFRELFRLKARQMRTSVSEKGSMAATIMLPIGVARGYRNELLMVGLE